MTTMTTNIDELERKRSSLLAALAPLHARRAELGERFVAVRTSAVWAALSEQLDTILAEIEVLRGEVKEIDKALLENPDLKYPARPPRPRAP